MADVQIAVGLGRETGLDGGVFTAFEIVFDDGADEVVVGELVFVEHGGIRSGSLKIKRRILPETAALVRRRVRQNFTLRRKTFTLMPAGSGTRVKSLPESLRLM